MIRLWPKLLIWKLTLCVVLLTALACGFYVVLMQQLLFEYQDARDQELLWDMANALTKELEPHTNPSVSAESLELRVLQLREIAPHVSIFIVSLDGLVLFPFEFSQFQARVDIANLKQFLAADGYSAVPLRVAEPYLGDVHETRKLYHLPPSVFSAATIQFNGKPALLYVPLRSRRYINANRSWGDYAILRFIIALSIVSFLFLCTLGLVVYFLITRRFGTMTRRIQAFQGGDFTTRIAEHSSDEIGVHASAFNHMADTIEANIQNLERVDTLRRELISNVSHELRRPLAVMSASLETLCSDASLLPEEERVQFLDILRSNCTDLSELVNDLFELSILDSSGEEMSKNSFDLEELAVELIGQLKFLGQQAGVSLQLECPNPLPLVWGDPRLIGMAVSNLLENGIRYSNDGGNVTLKLQSEESGVKVSIVDTGIGIPADELGHIFERFYRSKHAKMHEQGGTGLGLAITQRIIAKHGGSIAVDSDVGIGSIFSFHLTTEQYKQTGTGKAN